jgi:tRNA threonylcarbamoyladenosine biosynthesis protein TsaB
MHSLTIDSATKRCGAGLLRDGVLLAHQESAGGLGDATRLPALIRGVLDYAGLAARELDRIGVILGPGSFTGLRAGLALAQGLAMASGASLIGVTRGEAAAAAVAAPAGGEFWVATDTRRGPVFLERCPGTAAAWRGSVTAASLPEPAGPVVLMGDDGARLVADWLAARGIIAARRIEAPIPPLAIAAIADRRAAGLLAALPLLPLYIDPPAAKLPREGLRPAPR